VALFELRRDLIVAGNILSHPGVADDVYQVQALVRAVLQHIGDQVLELFSEETLSVRLAVVLPEKICAVRHDQLVVAIIGVSLVKWWVASVQDEKNDAQSEQIDCGTVVRLFLDDLRSHVGESTQLSCEVAGTVAASCGCSETEVSNLHVEVFVEHDVLRLEVTVSKTLFLRVEDSLEHLFKVSTCDAGLEGADRNEVEQFTAVDKLESHVGNFHIAAAALFPNSVFLEVNELHNVLVLESHVGSDLILEGLQGLGGVLGAALVENLESDVLALGISSKLYLGGDTASKRLYARILVNC